jgi:hypothetical protein
VIDVKEQRPYLGLQPLPQNEPQNPELEQQFEHFGLFSPQRALLRSFARLFVPVVARASPNANNANSFIQSVKTCV